MTVTAPRFMALAIVLLGVNLGESTATPMKRIELFREPSGFPPLHPSTNYPPTGSLSTRSPFNRSSKIEQDHATERPSDVIYLIENLDPKATNNISDVLARFQDAYNVSVSSAGGFGIDSENKTFEILKGDWLNKNDSLKSVIIPITLDNSTISGGVFRQNQRRSRNLLKAVKGLIENGEGKMQYSGGLTASQSLKLFGKVFHAVVHITYGKPTPEAGSVEDATTDKDSKDDSVNEITFSPTTEKELFELIAGVRGYTDISQAPSGKSDTVRRTNYEDQGTTDTYECNDSDKNCENHEGENQESGLRHNGDNSISHDSESSESDMSDSHHSEYRSSDSEHHGDDSHDDCQGDSESTDHSSLSPCEYLESEGSKNSHESSHSDSASEDSTVTENLNSYSDSGSVYNSGSQSESGYESNSDERFANSEDDRFRVADGVDEKNKNVTTSNNKTNSANNKNSIDKIVLSGGKKKFVKDEGNKKVMTNKISHDKDREGTDDDFSDSFPALSQVIPFINGSFIDETQPNVGYYNIYNKPNLLLQHSGKFRLPVPNKSYLNWNIRRGNGSQENRPAHNVNDNNKFDLGINYGVIVNETISRTNNKYIENFEEKQDNSDQNSGDQTRGGDDNGVNEDKGSGNHKRHSELVEAETTNDDVTDVNNNEDSVKKIKDTYISKPNTGSLEINKANDDTTEHNSEENIGSGNDESNGEESGNGSSNNNVSKPNSGSLEVNKGILDTTEQSGNDDSNNDDDSGNGSSNNNISKPTSGSLKVKKANIDTTENNTEEKSGSGNNDSNDDSGNRSSNTYISKHNSGSVEIKKANGDRTEDNEDKSGSGNNDSNDDSGNRSSNTYISKHNSGSVEIKKANGDTTEDNEDKSGSGNNDSNDNESGNGNGSSNNKASSGSLEIKKAKYVDTTEHNSEEKSENGNASNDTEDSSNADQNKKKKISIKVGQSQKHTQAADTTIYKRIALRKKVTGIKGGKGNAKNYIHKHQKSDSTGDASVTEAEEETRETPADIFNNNIVLNTLPQFSKVSPYPFQRQHKESVFTNSKHWFATEKRNKYLSWNDRLKQLAKISNVYV